MNFTPEQIAKAKAAKNAEELLALAKENGMELTAEQAEKAFDSIQRSCELNDEELGDVTGGKFYTDEYFDSPDKVTFVHKKGDIVEVSTGWFSTTVRCCITDVRVVSFWISRKNFLGLPPMANGYRDEYYCTPLEEHWYFSGDWYLRTDLEM